MLKKYYQLMKPGIIFGNAITALGGFALASQGHLDLSLLFWTLLGLSLIIGASCVYNNYLDRKADAKMKRTSQRALVQGIITPQRALFFAALLFILGSICLGALVNLLSLSLAVFGVFVYLLLYTPLKYRTSFGTLIGSIAGGVPPVVGYAAAKGALDGGAALIFVILVLWQMPHFFAIALYRMEEFASASIPVLPIVKGAKRAKLHMLCYISAFLMTATMPTFFGYTGYCYFIVATAMGLIWLYFCLKGFSAPSDPVWGRKMFVISLQVITLLSVMITLDS